MKVTFLLGIFILLLSCQDICFAQCKEKRSESTQQKVRYQTIQLNGKHEYLTLSSIGDEKLFSYSNELIDLVFHVQMFTEIKITSSKGDFSLFMTTSDRTRWNRCFTLTAPLTPKELEKMRGASKIQVILPEEKKVFTLSTEKNEQLNKALGCLF
jgi:hypothetical protein